MATRVEFTRQLSDMEGLLARFAEKSATDVRAAGLAASGDCGAETGVLEGRKPADRLRQEIESLCLDIMQQPLIGEDLRFVSASFRLVSDLAQIDSMTRDVAFVFSEMPADVTTRLSDSFVHMSEQAAKMVDDGIEAFLTKNVELAQKVIASDDVLDKMYAAAEAVVVELIRQGQPSPRSLPELLMAAKYFERIGDQAQRIADWAVFRATGERILTGGDHSAANTDGE